MNKRTTKLLIFLLVLTLLTSITIGCGKPSKENGKKPGDKTDEGKNNGNNDEPEYDFGGRVIKVATWWGDDFAERGEWDRGDMALDRLEELKTKYNATMEYVSVPMDQYLEKFTSSTLAGQPWADILEMHVMWFFPGLVSSGFVLQLDDLDVFDFEESKWNQATLKFGTYKDGIYGMGTGSGGTVNGIYWNKTMFERENQPNLYELQEKKEWTWEKMRQIAKALTKDTDGDGVIDQWGMDPSFLDTPIIVSNKSGLISMIDGQPKFVLGGKNGIEALQFLQDLKTVDSVMHIAPEGSNWDYGMQQFAAGNIGMIAGPLWTNGTYEESMEDEYGFVCIPMGPQASDYVSVSSGFNLTVFPSTLKKPEEVAMWWNDWTDYLPGDDEDTWKEDWEEEGFTGDRESARAIIYLIENNLFEADFVESFPTAHSYISNAVNEVTNGEKTPQSAIDEIKDAVEQNLEDIMEELEDSE